MHPKVGCNRLTEVTRHVNMLYKIRNVSASDVLSLWAVAGFGFSRDSCFNRVSWSIP